MNDNRQDGVWLFAYGTLRDPDVQRAVFGREPETEVDSLAGYRLATVSIGGGTYRTLRPAPDGGERIEGLVLRLRAPELARADSYEGDTDYVRVGVALESGRNAFVYLSASA